MSDGMLRGRGLRKHYVKTTDRDVLKGIDFTLERGEYVAVMGKSGSGKSTLLHLLGGMDKPTAGEVWFENECVSHMNERKLCDFRRRRVGFVHQSFNLIESMTALENVVVPSLLAGLSLGAARERARRLFKQLEIDDLERATSNAMSGGQKQRVAIARALVNQPAIILADEPTGSLDTESGETVMRIMRRLHNDGISLVIVTHDAKVASQADRVLILRDGAWAEEAVLPGTGSGTLRSRVLDTL